MKLKKTELCLGHWYATSFIRHIFKKKNINSSILEWLGRKRLRLESIFEECVDMVDLVLSDNFNLKIVDFQPSRES